MTGKASSETIDYGESGMTIQQAMMDLARRIPVKEKRPGFVRWNGLQVQTVDPIPVPNRGTVSLEFVSAKPGIDHGCDLLLNGWLTLVNGFKVDHLRTWNDPEFESKVEYNYECKDGKIWFSNVYKRRFPAGRVIEEKWVENAGFWVEAKDPLHRTYHCSAGVLTPPDFESLVVEINITPQRSI